MNNVLQYAITYRTVLQRKCRNKTLKYVTTSFLVYFNFSVTMTITVDDFGGAVFAQAFDSVVN
jgi:hypothetical protein